jgi:uncharacterized protein YggU (UPF0235/DUF167 family)
LHPVAKPGTDFPPAAAIRALADADGRLAVRVTPGARAETLEIAGGRLLIRVRARPEDGKANAVVQELLAKAVGVAVTRLTLLRGATSREKLFQIKD